MRSPNVLWRLKGIWYLLIYCIYCYSRVPSRNGSFEDELSPKWYLVWQIKEAWSMAVLENASEFWLHKTHFKILAIGKVWASNFLVKQTHDFLIKKSDIILAN